MWQTAESGRVAGIPGDTDLDVFNGTVADLRAFAGAGSASLPLEVRVTRDASGVQTFTARGDSSVKTAAFRVDGFALAAPSQDASGTFVLRTSLTSNVEQRRFEASGFTSTGALVARGIALFDATDAPGVQIRQVGAATYEISLDRAPAAVAAIEVRADGFLLRDSVTGSTRSTRLAVRSPFTLLGTRTFRLSTFNADGTLRGTLERTFSLE